MKQFSVLCILDAEHRRRAIDKLTIIATCQLAQAGLECTALRREMFFVHVQSIMASLMNGAR
jgi:hypothetical protein